MFTWWEWFVGAFLVLVAVMVVAIPVVLSLVARNVRGMVRGSGTIRGVSAGAVFTPRVPSTQNGTPPIAEGQWPLVPGQTIPDPEATVPHHHEAPCQNVPFPETAHHHGVQHHHAPPRVSGYSETLPQSGRSWTQAGRPPRGGGSGGEA